MKFVKVVVVTVAVALIAGGCSSKKGKKHFPQPLQITTTSLSDAYEGALYRHTVSAAGGNSANYSWSISSQPSWLPIDATTGELSGTPPAGSAGTYTFTVEVTDGRQTVSKRFDLELKAPLLRADFEASPTYGTAPLTVNFTDKSNG